MRNALWLFLLVIVHAAIAQDCTRTIPITVLNVSSNDPVVFQPTLLHASMEGHPLVISRFEKITGRRILFLLDASGSMEKSKFVKDVLEALLQQIPPGSSLAYGSFSDSVHLSDGFTTRQDEIRKALDQFQASEIKGKTALFDALDQGLKLFQQPTPGDSILLISDGGENHSTVQKKQLEKELHESRIRLFAIVPIHDMHIAIEEELGPRSLLEWTEKTGGSALMITDDDNRWSFKKSREQMISSIRRFWLETVGSGYLLTVQLPSDVKKPARWKLHLDTSGDKHLNGLSVAYPEKLMPCSFTAAAVH